MLSRPTPTLVFNSYVMLSNACPLYMYPDVQHWSALEYNPAFIRSLACPPIKRDASFYRSDMKYEIIMAEAWRYSCEMVLKFGF
jgi:hypothetical protein